MNFEIVSMCRSIVMDVADAASNVETVEKKTCDHATETDGDRSVERSLGRSVSLSSIQLLEKSYSEDSGLHSSLSPSIPDCYICAYPINTVTENYRKRPLKLPCECKNIAHADCVLRWISKKGKVSYVQVRLSLHGAACPRSASK